MSEDLVNNSVDGRIDALLAYVFAWVPKSWLIKGLILYTWAVDAFQFFSKQAQRTSAAVLSSFTEDTIYFLKNANNLAVKATGLPEPVWVASEYNWTYHPSSMTFVEKDHETAAPKRFSWLSVDLKCDELLYADMTLWLEKIHYKGAQPPNDILVQAWALDHNRTLGPLRDYRLDILTDEAEELTLPVRAI